MFLIHNFIIHSLRNRKAMLEEYIIKVLRLKDWGEIKIKEMYLSKSGARYKKFFWHHFDRFSVILADLRRGVYVTITWGAAARTATVATIVNKVKTIKHSRSSTIAANFQSFSIVADSSSSRILSVIILISFRIKLSSLKQYWV